MVATTLDQDIAVSPPDATLSRTRWLGRIWGIWLALFSVASFTLRPPPVRDTIDFEQFRDPGPKLAAALAILALASLGPALWGAFTFGVDFRRAKYLVVVAFLVCLSIPLSYLIPTDPQSIVYVVLVYTVMIAGLISVATNVDGAVMLSSLMATVAVTQGLMLVWVLKDHDYFWGRLFGRVQPNYWGEVAQAAIVAAICMRGWVLRASVVAICLFILYATQSRGSMVAMAAGLVLAFVLFTATSRWRAPLWIAAVLGSVFIGLAGSGFIANDLFKVSDPLRGAGSGMTGRAAAWSETMNLIADHPWVGVGYRQHEKYLTTEASAHNAYLATTADTGMFGLAAYMLFLCGGLWRWSLKALRHPSPAALAGAAYLLGFMVDGLFERSALNTGNTYCQLMILLAAWAWRQDDVDARGI